MIKPRVITIFWFLKHKNTLVCELKENNLEQSLCHSVSSLLIVRVSKKKKKKKHLSAQWRRGEGCREITKSGGGRD